MLNHFCKGRKWFLVIVAGALGTFSAAQAGYAQGTWTTLAPVSPSPTEGMTVGGVGQVIVGAYGFSSTLGGNTNQTRLYNISTDSWSTGAAVIDDGIFVIGGRQSTSGPCSGGPYLETVEKYDIDTDTWSAVAPLPNPRSDMAAVAHGGKVFVFGGCTGTASAPSVTKEVDMYDPQTN